MSAFTDFDAARRTRDSVEPFKFKLAGEYFVCPRDGDVMPLLDMAAAASSMLGASDDVEEDPRAVGEVMKTMVDFITNLVGPDDQVRFMAALRRYRPDFNELSTIMSAVMQGVVGRPLDQPSASPGSTSDTGAPSKGASSSEAMGGSVIVAETAPSAITPSSV